MLLISPWKLFSFSRNLSFCLDFLAMQKNGLIRKIKLILTFRTSQPGWQTNAIHILNNISRSKGIQAMKFVQLIEYYMRNIFREKSYTECGGENIPTPFSKKSKLSYLWINSSKFCILCCIVCQVVDYRNMLKLSCRPLAFTSHEAFFSEKKRSFWN